MSSKKALTDEELFAQFEDIPSETPSTASSKALKPAKATTDPAPIEEDPLAELSALAAARPASRPSTPRLSSSTTSAGTSRKIETPVSSGPPSGRTSEDRLRTTGISAGRKSTESTRSYHQSYTASVQDASDADAPKRVSSTDTARSPEIAEKAAPSPAAGGGWWGSVFNVASAAVKQAEAAVKEIQGNEEAKRWAEQVKGNVESLRGFGKC